MNVKHVKASISPGYRWRLLIISVALLGFGAYCVYDWQIGYPAMVDKYEAHRRIVEENPDNHPVVWREYARSQGWGEHEPKKKTDRDVFTQFLMACIVLPFGVFFLYKFFRENSRWVAMDDAGLTASGGREVPWDRMEQLDETRWKSKGIAWLHYRDEQGQSRKLLLDDFKAEREPIKTIVEAVQQHLYPERASAAAPAADAGVTNSEAYPGTHIAPGQVYAQPEDGGRFSIVKILAVDDQAVHLRTYAERFDEPPVEIDTDTLTVDIGHAPLAAASFAPEAGDLITAERVQHEELEGYRIWSGESV